MHTYQNTLFRRIVRWHRGLGAEGDSVVGIERRLTVPDSGAARFVVGKYVRVGTVVLEVTVVCNTCYETG